MSFFVYTLYHDTFDKNFLKTKKYGLLAFQRTRVYPDISNGLDLRASYAKVQLGTQRKSCYRFVMGNAYFIAYFSAIMSKNVHYK